MDPAPILTTNDDSDGGLYPKDSAMSPGVKMVKNVLNVQRGVLFLEANLCVPPLN